MKNDGETAIKVTFCAGGKHFYLLKLNKACIIRDTSIFFSW